MVIGATLAVGLGIGGASAAAATKIYVGSYPDQVLCAEQGEGDLAAGAASSWSCELEPDGSWSLYEAL
ncbi:hypothetical protein O7626_35850 [Micromonospora sp. WMMD1102]|uniref:hypothetical protein n=1 Tax=Micromonospora sp. WMMD1102 TaxID=3016105 RepID=UPI00241542F0|nr:hypothetical protein [Micromonospora sp. WMMD1102]MDG4791212.1 hypothetical protein [Micromonospora sp. WMMD1102]